MAWARPYLEKESITHKQKVVGWGDTGWWSGSRCRPYVEAAVLLGVGGGRKKRKDSVFAGHCCEIDSLC
jgi:hypothetical protein